MTPEERENTLYSNGKRCQIALEERVLFEYLENHVQPGSTVLDIGCGSGEITRQIQTKGYSVKGLDFSPVAVELASKHIDCQRANLDEGIPFADNSFDVIWAGDVIEHVFDPLFVFKEINRVLTPGGYLLCTIPYDLKLTTRLRVLFGHSYQESVYRQFGQYKHHTFFSLPLMKYMFTQASLTIEEIKYIAQFPKTKTNFVTNKNILKYFANTTIVRGRSHTSK